MNKEELALIIEAVLFSEQKAFSIKEIQALFDEIEKPSVDEIKEALKEINQKYEPLALELKEVASGFRMQIKERFSPWISRLFTEKPVRYSRAFYETLALIAYKQPISRGEIEEIRGVSVSSQIIKTLLEREWIKVVGQKEVPGKPNIYGTTNQFLDDFNLKSLSELPELSEFNQIEDVHV